MRVEQGRGVVDQRKPKMSRQRTLTFMEYCLCMFLLISSISISNFSAMAQSTTATWDLASQSLAHGWIVHLVVGEASFDSFVHHPGGPVYNGSGDDPWAVNGFLFSGHPESAQNQTLYAGLYGQDYRPPMSMLGLVSTDGGATFAASPGPLVCDSRTLLYGIAHGCPDGSAIIDTDTHGVHMVFDWNGGGDSGLGCATSWQKLFVTSLHDGVRCPAESDDC